MTCVKHVVLVGDSIFDNDGYVLGEAGVLEQLRSSMPSGWSASKVAVDGDCISHVSAQIRKLPTNATDLVVSIGGNDARYYSNALKNARSPDDLVEILREPLTTFQQQYYQMLSELVATGLNLHVCTIYTAIPFEDPLLRQFAPYCLDQFNAVIIAEAEMVGIPVLRLDHVCTQPDDFSTTSPIEPSSKGGQKIVDHIIHGLSEKT